ncbi:MAG: TRAP transporter substrate-binding protein DctP [Oscillospiraceae bacterium]|nr:TRAP transporter substrate-binding protein DctP [Oscillospiraceae bacterium]
MRRTLSLLMAAAMLLTLASCGKQSAGESTVTETTGAETEPVESSLPAEETPSAETEVSVESGTSEETASGEVDYTAAEAITIHWLSAYDESETGGLLTQTFADYLYALTGGAMEVEITWASDAGLFTALSSGTADMTILDYDAYADTLSYLGVLQAVPGGMEDAMALLNQLVFEQDETASLIQSELSDNGICFLEQSALPGFANVFCTNYEFMDLISLTGQSQSFGATEAAPFSLLGFQVTELSPGDCYDGLQTGLIDTTHTSLSTVVSMHWYDAAMFWTLDGTYTAGGYLAANQDWWNGLSQIQQAALQAASDYAVEQAVELYTQSENDTIAAIEETVGFAFLTLSQEDYDTIWNAYFNAWADAALVASSDGNLGAILEVCAELTGADWIITN